jgi:hypothetical protein
MAILLSVSLRIMSKGQRELDVGYYAIVWYAGGVITEFLR